MEKFSEIYFGISGAAEVLIGYHYFYRLARRKSCLKIAASAIIVVTIIQLCFGVMNSVIGMLSTVMIGKNPDFTAAVMILFNLLSLFLACVLCEIMLKYFSDKIPYIPNNILNLKYILVPLLMIMGIGLYINHIFFNNTISENQFENVSKKIPAMLVFQVLGLSAIFCILRICGEIIKNKIELEYAELRAENAESRCEKTKAFRHDVKNHMVVLTGFLNSGDINGAEKYLSEMKIIADDLSLRFQTGRAVADILINSKLSAAEKKGICTCCEMRIPDCKISDSDLCVILANTIDNAVHACEKLDNDSEKFIEVSGIVQENIFLIEVKNSFDGKSFKKGTGLKNIETAAKKYGGYAKISYTEDIFTISVLLNISQH